MICKRRNYRYKESPQHAYVRVFCLSRLLLTCAIRVCGLGCLVRPLLPTPCLLSEWYRGRYFSDQWVFYLSDRHETLSGSVGYQRAPLPVRRGRSRQGAMSGRWNTSDPFAPGRCPRRRVRVLGFEKQFACRLQVQPDVCRAWNMARHVTIGRRRWL